MPPEVRGLVVPVAIGWRRRLLEDLNEGSRAPGNRWT